MKIVFMGTPSFAVHSLETIFNSKHKIMAVVTSVDKPAGRGQKIQHSPVKEFALKNNLPIIQPNSLKEQSFISTLKEIKADLYVVVAFRILPEEVWSIPAKGTINLHASLLPQYRGAAPINWAIINGEKETGVTTFFIKNGVDTGSIIMQKKVRIDEQDNAGTLHDKLMKEGSILLLKTLDAIENDNVHPIPQENITKDNEIKNAPKIFKEHCQIDWTKNSQSIHNLIRGLSPTLGAFSYLTNDKKILIKILSSEYDNIFFNNAPGTIISDKKNELNVVTGKGILKIKELQPEGKKKMTTSEFLNGFRNIENYMFE